MDITRRDFLKGLALAPALPLLAKAEAAFPGLSQEAIEDSVGATLNDIADNGLLYMKNPSTGNIMQWSPILRDKANIVYCFPDGSPVTPEDIAQHARALDRQEAAIRTRQWSESKK